MSVYSASCNPARRVKLAPQAAATTTGTARLPPSIPTKSAASPDDDDPPPPAKRGRKPGAMSRSARETQRKLNHSIIEKARRTKINEALATLKQLVPPNFQQPKPTADAADDEEEVDGDEDYADGSDKPSKPKAKGGKKEEKEKEFKLEILIRTVSFMQVLLERNEALEQAVVAAQCSDCSAQSSHKRKRSHSPEDMAREPKRQTAPAVDQSPRLPSISSWMPRFEIDPVLLATSTSSAPTSQLPSPPSSTHFSPMVTSQLPPTLNLTPAYVRRDDPHRSHIRTADEEFAATLLLQIRGSSPVVPQTPSSMLGL